MEPAFEEIKNINKRFSDAELAAEYWKAKHTTHTRVYQTDEDGYIYGPSGVKWEYEHEVLKRFAMRPHYDEGDSLD